MKKGISPLVGHTIYIAIAITALGMMLVSVSQVKENTEDASAINQMNLYSDRILSSVSKLYSFSNQLEYEPSSGEEMILMQLKPSVPRMIAGNKYQISLSSVLKTSMVTSFGKSVEVERELPMTIGFDGESSGPVVLKLIRYNDGEIKDKIVVDQSG